MKDHIFDLQIRNRSEDMIDHGSFHTKHPGMDHRVFIGKYKSEIIGR